MKNSPNIIRRRDLEKYAKAFALYIRMMQQGLVKQMSILSTTV